MPLLNLKSCTRNPARTGEIPHTVLNPKPWSVVGGVCLEPKPSAFNFCKQSSFQSGGEGLGFGVRSLRDFPKQDQPCSLEHGTFQELEGYFVWEFPKIGDPNIVP